MRLVGAALILCFVVFPAAAQTGDASSPNGATAKPSSKSGTFRKLTAGKAATLRARAAAIGRERAAAEQKQPDASAGGDGTIRVAAAAKKKAAAPPLAGPPKDSASLPLAERVAIQFDLTWTGDYTGFANGEAADKLVAAIKSFQRNRKFKETGLLNSQERALLAAAAKAKQTQVGWIMVDDTVTGARIGLANNQTPNKSAAKAGTRWASAQGQVQVETFKIREPGTTLNAVYERQMKEPSTRKLAANQIKGDSFILSGMQGLKKFVVRGEFKDGEVRGITVLWDQATETIMDPIAVAMSNAFTPFPGVTGTIAQIGAAPKRKVEYGTGIVVSAAGHILTDRQVTDGCNVIVVSGYGDASPQAEDRTADLALIRVYGAPDLVPAALNAEGTKGPELTLVGIADPQSQSGGSAITTAAVRLKGDMVEPAPALGFSGAPVLDGQGRFVGMAELKTPVVATAGPAAAQPQAMLVSFQAIRSFLDAQQVAPASGTAGIDAAKASVVRVICVRK